MKKLFLSLALSLVVLSSFAQSSPQLIWQPPPSSLGQTAGGAPFNYIGGSRVQSMYKPTEFPGLTASSIIAVYLRASTDRQNQMSFRNLRVKMCHWTVNESGPNPDTLPHSVQPVSFIPCDTVLYVQSFTIPTPIDSGDWIKFTLQAPFQYDGTRNFFVEFSHDSGSLVQPIPLVNTVAFKQVARSYFAGSPNFTGNWYPASTPAYINLIGLDMAPNSVTSVSGLKDMQLYPNPASDKIYLSDAGQVSYNIVDIAGKTVLAGSYDTKGIDISTLSTGFYIVKMKNGFNTVSSHKFVKQ